MISLSVPLVAIDSGPKSALMPLAGYGASFVDVPAREGVEQSWWERMILASAWQGLCVGTSDSNHGRRVEAAARRAATRLRRRIVAIEDYAGNFQAIEGTRTDLLIVESSPVAGLHRERLGQDCPETWVCSPARYDHMRSACSELREGARGATKAKLGSGGCVLWAGQPETMDALVTLERLLPSVGKLGVGLLFKAHPRDEGYQTGVYRSVLAASGVDYRDVTDKGLTECMAYGPRLVLTQFSSMAVEAGFYGVPAVHVLFEDVGFARLRATKGYGIPPWCSLGASFIVTRTEELERVLVEALDNGQERSDAIARFDAYFSVNDHTSAILADKVIRTICVAGARGDIVAGSSRGE